MRSINVLVFLRRIAFFVALTLGVFQIENFAETDSRIAAKETNEQSVVWQRKTDDTIQEFGRRLIVPEKYAVYGLNRDNLKTILDGAPLEFSIEAAMAKSLILEIPAPGGKMARFRVEETPLLSAELAARFPGWKTYQGYGVDDPTATARFDVTPSGFHAYVLSGINGTYAIDPLQENDRGNYIVYAKSDFHTEKSFACEVHTDPSLLNSRIETPDASADFSTGTQIRTYRLAVAATAEYTNYFRQASDTDEQAQTRALNAIVTTVNRVTGIYRRDVALSFTLVSGVNLIYTNTTTDPYANSSADLTANQTNIDSVIGTANYDIGHLVGTGGGGIAGVGVPCRAASKARGLTGSAAPVGDPFDIDYVAHEIGHQTGALHTFNASNGSCGGVNRSASAAFEPGSGATIMSYAGICGIADLQRNSIDNFHVYSQTEIVNYTTGSGGGATCGTLSGTNSVPVIAPLTNYTIPFNTPFALTASASDADGDQLTYSWEQFNLGVVSNYPATSDDDDLTGGIRPLFRTYTPTANASRTFPSLPYILNNANEAPINFNGTAPTGIVCRIGTCVTGEDLPSVARLLNFRVSVRDGRGGISDAGVTVNSINTTTPFRVRSANTAANFLAGANRFIVWDVSGTNAAPISAANVRISLSTDGGLTFPTVLADSTANDGAESVFIPNTPTTQARIKVEAVGNIFFDVNDANITIGSTAGAAEVAGGVVAITGESCATPNGQPDPGETLTVSLPLSNIGGSSAVNLTATLQATGGVASAVSQSYGVVAADGSTVIRNFTFTINQNLPCGTPVTLTFTVSDGATTFPSVTATFRTGTPSVTLNENFDAVTAPALPSGWTSVQTIGTNINWVTTTVTPDSPPNAAFGNAPVTIEAAALVSPAVNISGAGSQLKFRNRFNLEDTYDGVVLEFSTDGGSTWTDIITGGGTFVSGGYTDTISSADGSPIPGRRAWSGNSGGYIDTLVNLPASLSGQAVRFRWLLATDNGVTVPGGGAWVDGVQILGAPTCSTSCGTTNNACNIQRRNDFNGDGTTDYAVFRPSNGIWYVLTNGSNAFSGVQFGASGDKLVPADYDGDGRTDVAVYRGGTWYITQSSDNAFRGVGFGAATDIPVAGDFTGDGKADIAVYRPSTGIWYVSNSTGGALIAVQFGGDATDIPVVGDFDGDCKMDFAVRRTTNLSTNASQYYILKSSGGSTSVVFGRSDMLMAIGDYNGDGKSDIGVVDPRGGSYFWYAIGVDSGALLVNAVQFGQTGDEVTAGDYNGDGATDISIWRPSNGVFYSRGAVNAALLAQPFGAANDTPTARWYQQQLP